MLRPQRIKVKSKFNNKGKFKTRSEVSLASFLLLA